MVLVFPRSECLKYAIFPTLPIASMQNLFIVVTLNTIPYSRITQNVHNYSLRTVYNYSLQMQYVIKIKYQRARVYVQYVCLKVRADSTIENCTHWLLLETTYITSTIDSVAVEVNLPSLQTKLLCCRMIAGLSRHAPRQRNTQTSPKNAAHCSLPSVRKRRNVYKLLINSLVKWIPRNYRLQPRRNVPFTATLRK